MNQYNCCLLPPDLSAQIEKTFCFPKVTLVTNY